MSWLWLVLPLALAAGSAALSAAAGRLDTEVRALDRAVSDLPRLGTATRALAAEGRELRASWRGRLRR